MVHGRVTSAHFDYIIDKVSQRLASWRGKLLNRAGRVTLVNSVVAAIPSYTMQFQWLPQTICDALDREARQFIWSGDGTRKLHLARWDIVTRARRHGGLSVRIARLQNIALLGKLLWDVGHREDKIWVQFVLNKYPGATLQHRLDVKGSNFWSALAKTYTQLHDGFQLQLGCRTRTVLV
uniref:Ribonuclease H protein At1g65750 family n=1 Tax=Cajanus cajan TaxID=3821 RepID=A0A151SST0_CAJCA|nr:Putative ribonuclease H protein At1g65750 family [Cajanus cajan]